MSREHAKRPHESHWQWHARLALLRQQERDREQPLVTPEAMRQAEYEDATVMHVESGTRVETKRRKSISSLVRMHGTGKIDNAQFEAAMRIGRIAERIEGAVGVRCASLEARVDCSNGSRDVLLERLGQVRDEIAYGRWRRQIPLPRRMILDMILVDRPLATTARIHGKRWEAARETFIRALDLFNELRERVGKEVDERDLDSAHARIARAA